jgi:hypothetical protein
MYDEYEDYDDSLRLDEMEQARGDYNLYEEEQVFQDREWENDLYTDDDYDEHDDSFADEMEVGPEDLAHEDWEFEGP